MAAERAAFHRRMAPSEDTRKKAPARLSRTASENSRSRAKSSSAARRLRVSSSMRSSARRAGARGAPRSERPASSLAIASEAMLASAVRSPFVSFLAVWSSTVNVPTTKPSDAARGRIPTKRACGPDATSGWVACSVTERSSMKSGAGRASWPNAKDCSRGRYAKATPARARSLSRRPSKNESQAIGKEATSWARRTSSSKAGSGWSGSRTP